MNEAPLLTCVAIEVRDQVLGNRLNGQWRLVKIYSERETVRCQDRRYTLLTDSTLPLMVYRSGTAFSRVLM